MRKKPSPNYETYLDWEKSEEFKKLKRYLNKAKKEADIACQALHEYRDVVATDARSLGSASLMREDLRQLQSGHWYTGLRAAEALKKMPQAVKRRADAYKKLKGDE